MINQHIISSPPKRQSGVVLVISLIMLLALTMIGVTSSSVTGLEEKMSANTKDMNLAFQAAEAALRTAEASLTTKPAFDRAATDASQGVNGLYSSLINCLSTTASDNLRTAGSTSPSVPASTPPLVTSLRPFYEKVDWFGTKVITYANGSSSTPRLVGLAHVPVYTIEEISCTPPLSLSSSTVDSYESGSQESVGTGEVLMLRITAHGWGSNINSVATVQSIVKVTYQN